MQFGVIVAYAKGSKIRWALRFMRFLVTVGPRKALIGSIGAPDKYHDGVQPDDQTSSRKLRAKGMLCLVSIKQGFPGPLCPLHFHEVGELDEVGVQRRIIASCVIFAELNYCLYVREQLKEQVCLTAIRTDKLEKMQKAKLHLESRAAKESHAVDML
uniref:Transmembrane protein n=1 Tax=Haemonchus contortus TaxID=6289 RepID=A0A7I4YCY6_HAECO